MASLRGRSGYALRKIGAFPAHREVTEHGERQRPVERRGDGAEQHHYRGRRGRDHGHIAAREQQRDHAR